MGDASRAAAVLQEVLEERQRQVAKYGSNDGLEDGTGPLASWLKPFSHASASTAEKGFRRDYEVYEDTHGEPTWALLVREEVAEAFQESDPALLRAELLQVAALCVSWVETLDNRKEELS